MQRGRMSGCRGMSWRRSKLINKAYSLKPVMGLFLSRVPFPMAGSFCGWWTRLADVLRPDLSGELYSAFMRQYWHEDSIKP